MRKRWRATQIVVALLAFTASAGAETPPGVADTLISHAWQSLEQVTDLRERTSLLIYFVPPLAERGDQERLAKILPELEAISQNEAVPAVARFRITAAAAHAYAVTSKRAEYEKTIAPLIEENDTNEPVLGEPRIDRELTFAMADAGDVDRLKQHFDGSRSGRRTSVHLPPLCQYLREKNREPIALELLRHLEVPIAALTDISWRSSRAEELVRAYVAAGLVDEAKAVAEKHIVTPLERGEAWTRIAAEEYRSGRKDAAAADLKRANLAFGQATVLYASAVPLGYGQSAKELHAAGDVDGAVAFARESVRLTEKDSLATIMLARMAVIAIDGRDTVLAEQTIQKIRDFADQASRPHAEAELRFQLAAALAKSGEIEEAKNQFAAAEGKLPPEQFRADIARAARDRSLRELAMKMASEGKFDEATGFASKIAHPDSRLPAITAVVEAAMRQKTLVEALPLVDLFHETKEVNAAYRGILGPLARQGRLKELTGLLDKLPPAAQAMACLDVYGLLQGPPGAGE